MKDSIVIHGKVKRILSTLKRFKDRDNENEWEEPVGTIIIEVDDVEHLGLLMAQQANQLRFEISDVQSVMALVDKG